MDYRPDPLPQQSPGGSMLSFRSPPPSLVSPKVESPSPFMEAGSPIDAAGSPLIGESPLELPRSPTSPSAMLVKSEPPMSPMSLDYSGNNVPSHKKVRAGGAEFGGAEWIPSPGTMSVDSPPPSNGHQQGPYLSSGLSPLSSSSYDPYSPSPKIGKCDASRWMCERGFEEAGKDRR
ncbi:ecdysone receptor-like [Oratosquilla oratoria]|uniref:ecdysone receptor-like n=1 Tax=Oratosquilla oratoria TaxID=337810 RepID=UPI003F76430E